MTYGYKNYRNRNSKYSNRNSRYKRKVAVPKTKKPTRNYVKNNSKAINDLSRDIKKLKMSQYGRVQQNFQIANNTVSPTAALPVLFDATDITCFRERGGQIFSQGCRMWQYNPLGVLGNPGGFNIQDNLGNPFWENQNNDIVNGGCYFPTYIKYFFEISGNRSLDNTRVRVDFFSARTNTHIQSTSVADITRLPTALNHLSEMASPQENRLNKVFFKRYITKTVFINSSKTDQYTKGTTSNIKRFNITLHPKKARYQADTTPDTKNDPDVPAGLIDTGTFGPYNVPAEAPLWCLISTDDLLATGDSVVVNISRICRWRDPIGSAYLN